MKKNKNEIKKMNDLSKEILLIIYRKKIGMGKTIEVLTGIFSTLIHDAMLKENIDPDFSDDLIEEFCEEVRIRVDYLFKEGKGTD